MFELLVSKELISYQRPGNAMCRIQTRSFSSDNGMEAVGPLLERKRHCELPLFFEGKIICVFLVGFFGKYIQSLMGKLGDCRNKNAVEPGTIVPWLKTRNATILRDGHPDTSLRNFGIHSHRY